MVLIVDHLSCEALWEMGQLQLETAAYEQQIMEGGLLQRLSLGCAGDTRSGVISEGYKEIPAPILVTVKIPMQGSPSYIIIHQLLFIIS